MKELPEYIIPLWLWPVEVVDNLKSRWLRVILVFPALSLAIILLLIFGIPLMIAVLAEIPREMWTKQ